MILIKGTKFGSVIEQLFDTIQNAEEKIKYLEKNGYIVSITMKSDYTKEIMDDLNNLYSEEESYGKRFYN